MPIYVGVIGPKLLRLAGRIADGIIASIFASTAYLRWMRAQVAGGADPRRDERHRLACFAMFSVDHNADRALAALRPTMAFYLSVLAESKLIEVYGIREELAALNEGGPERIAAEMPDEWLRDLAVVGTPTDCVAQIRRLRDAGADSVALFPMPADQSADLIRLAGTDVLPRLGRAAAAQESVLGRAEREPQTLDLEHHRRDGSREPGDDAFDARDRRRPAGTPSREAPQRRAPPAPRGRSRSAGSVRAF